MIEIRFHGRGGQGAVIGSKVLAVALFAEGKYVQSFPAFGVERRGAPVMAFIRADESYIDLRCEIYTPDHIIVLDPSLLDAVDVSKGLKPGGTILINFDRPPSHFADRFKGYEVATINASGIAVRHELGSRQHPIVNTAILGAFARQTGLCSIDAIAEAVAGEVPFKVKANVQAARDAYEELVISEGVAQ
jgi:2-oxoacid:acceptor oxidoreductase gamma subunit (pyruvate/2-ketoisovalerate family)